MPGTTKVATRRPRKPRTARQEKEAPSALVERPVEVNIDDLEDFNESINWMVFGPSGHGKTRLAGFLPNATFLSTEKGVVAAKAAGSKAKLIRAPSWEHAVAGVKLADERLGKDDWLIVDSATKMQIMYMRWILEMENAMNPGRDIDIPAIQNHQKFQNGFRRWVDQMIEAPYNTCWILTEMIVEDNDGEDMVIPDLQGKGYAISNYVRAQMDIVTYYAVSARASTPEDTVRRALFQPYPPYVAKDRFDILGKFQDVHEGENSNAAEWMAMVQDSLADAA